MKQTRIQRSARSQPRRDVLAPDANPTAATSDTTAATALLRRIDRLVAGR